jgi:CHASE1-domain containing sensor protein
MTEGLLLASAVLLLAVGAANLAVAVLALRSARRYVELAESRMERLRKDHARCAR